METALTTTPPSAARSTTGYHLFDRIFTRNLMYAAILVVLPVILAQTLRVPAEMLRDADLWWHIADARTLVVTHHFIRTEPYSFTVTGKRWIDPEWLAEIVYWAGFRLFGLSGIYLVTWLLLASNVLFVYWRGCRYSGHASASFWAAALGFALMTLNSGPRTIITGYLCLSAELAIMDAWERGSRQPVWLLPPLFCLWINLHGSWIIGIGLFLLYILCGFVPANRGLFEQSARSREEARTLLSVLAVSLGALMVNPYGWRLIWNPLDMMFDQPLNIASAEEWHPLNLAWFAGKAAVLAIVLMIVAGCLRSRRWKLHEFAFVIFAWFAAFDHARFTFLAAVIAMPVLAAQMAHSFCARPASPGRPGMNALLTIGALIMLTRTFPSATSLRRDMADVYPEHLIASIQPGWRTFNSVAIGGEMAFDAKSSFMDSRLDTFEHHGVLADYIAIMHVQDTIALLDRYRIDHILYEKNTALAYLIERTPGWRAVMDEGQGPDEYVLFARAAHVAGRP